MESVKRNKSETDIQRSSRKSLPASQSVDIYNDPLYNSDGTRNLNIPFCIFVMRKLEKKRRLELKKKTARVSEVTPKDENVYREALKKLRREKARSNSLRMKYLKGLINSRGSRKISRRIEKGDGDTHYCPIKCPLSRTDLRNKNKSRSRSGSRSKRDQRKEAVGKKAEKITKPIIKLPPLKTKKWTSPIEKSKLDEARSTTKTNKISRHPVIIIPPFKTRKWVPKTKPKPKKKIVIEYPPINTK